MIKIRTGEHAKNDSDEIVFVHKETIDFNGEMIEYDFVINERKQIKLLRVLRAEFGIVDLGLLEQMIKEMKITNVALFDTLIDVVVDDNERVKDILKNGVIHKGVYDFFMICSNGLKVLSKKLEWKFKNEKNIPRKGGHRSTTGKPKQK